MSRQCMVMWVTSGHVVMVVSGVGCVIEDNRSADQLRLAVDLEARSCQARRVRRIQKVSTIQVKSLVVETLPSLVTVSMK